MGRVRFSKSGRHGRRRRDEILASNLDLKRYRLQFSQATRVADLLRTSRTRRPFKLRQPSGSSSLHSSVTKEGQARVKIHSRAFYSFARLATCCHPLDASRWLRTSGCLPGATQLASLRLTRSEKRTRAHPVSARTDIRMFPPTARRRDERRMTSRAGRGQSRSRFCRDINSTSDSSVSADAFASVDVPSWTLIGRTVRNSIQSRLFDDGLLNSATAANIPRFSARRFYSAATPR